MVLNTDRLSSRIESFRLSARRHGTLPTLLRYVDGLLHRVFKHEICRVELSSDDFSNLPDSEGYDTRLIEGEEFRATLCPELIDSAHDNAFARGDMCIASLHNGEVVGFTFYTDQPTDVNEAVEFRFSGNFIYNYASMTASSHRGHRLEGSRWKVGQIEQIARTGSDTPRVFYVNVTNLESRAAGRGYKRNKLLGYTGFCRFAGRWFCFRSAGCRRVDAGFWRKP